MELFFVHATSSPAAVACNSASVGPAVRTSILRVIETCSGAACEISVCVCVCPSACPPACLPVCLSACLSCAVHQPASCFFWFGGGAPWDGSRIGECSRFGSCGREIRRAEKASRRWRLSQTFLADLQLGGARSSFKSHASCRDLPPVCAPPMQGDAVYL